MFNRCYKTFLFSLFGAFVVYASFFPAYAQAVMRIAAVVNDDIISELDLAQRVRLTMTISRMPNTPEVQKSLAASLLRAMIDERLKLQEAKRLGIEVSETETDQALQRYASAQKIRPDRLNDFLTSIGVDRVILEDQANAELGWSSVISRTAGDRIQVSEEEVDKVMAEREANKGKPEYLYSEIYLPIDSPSEEDTARKMADSLIGHIQSGSPFDSLARDFSQSASAPNGGALGWVQTGHIDPKIETALIQMNEGDYSQPIRTISGFYILKLHEKRISGVEEQDELLDIAQAILPISPEAPAEAWAARNAQANTLAHQTQSCENLVELAKQIDGVNAGILKQLKLSSMPEDIRNTLAPMTANQITTLEQKKGAILVLMICNRAPVPTKPEITIRNELKRELRIEKINRESRRQLQQLRRSAFVDLRR
jgi:peptidyl-prolyl cis-trans isomerase SurA